MGNFKKPARVFDSFEKDCYFLKIQKWQYKFVWDYRRGNLVSYFLSNASKTCLYGLKISENIEFEHVFQSKEFFHLSSYLHTSCLSTFKYIPYLTVYYTLLNYYEAITGSEDIFYPRKGY